MSDIEYMKKRESVFPVIKNRKAFLLGEVPNLRPGTAKYIQFWRDEKKKCIEGYWAIDGKDSDLQKYRFMPPNLYFYVNFGTILHQVEGAPKTAPKKRIRPHLTDIEWAIFYNYMEARGFSGFSNDNVYTCCRDVLEYNNGGFLINDLDDSCINDDGEAKIYIPARDYIRKLWDEPMGVPLYQNQAKNLMLLAARGLGKSFSVAVGIVLHEILFDGARIYNEETIVNPAVAEVFVGAALSDKSSDLLAKMRDAYNNLPGVWAKGTDAEVPSPFFKEMSGSLAPNNQKNPWRHEYEKKVAGKWQKYGSKSHVYHGIWTSENPEAAAGTRPGVIVVEEVGLMSNLLTVLGSNTATQVTNGVDKFGTTILIGTGGNVLKIVESEIVFRDPESYDMLSFDDEWEDSGKMGWFISAAYADRKFKDPNGNTRLAEAIEAYEKRRLKKKEGKSRKALEMEMMNFPLVPSEMFLNVSNSRFPLSDIKARYAELMSGESKELASTWKGFFNIDRSGSVQWKNEEVMPIYEYPLKQGYDMGGCVNIFEMPIRDHQGLIPYGIYIAGYDPVDDDDNSDVSRSLQSFWIFNTLTDRFVLEYSARTKFVTEYYEQVRRALLFYNATVNYENQKKGFYAYMKNKNSLHLLADTPDILKDQGMQKSVGQGNKSKGTSANVAVNNWGIELQAEWLQRQAYDNEDLLNVHTIKSPAYLRECILFNGDRNTDRISSIGMLMIYREEVLKRTASIKERMNKPVERMADHMLNHLKQIQISHNMRGNNWRR